MMFLCSDVHHEREQVDVIHAGEQQMLQTPVKIEVKQVEIKEENTTEEQQSDEDAGEQQMLQTPVKIEVKQVEIKEETTTEEQQSDDDDDEQQMLQTPVKMCSVKLLDCRNLMKMRGETTAEEQQSDEDDVDFIPAGMLHGGMRTADVAKAINCNVRTWRRLRQHYRETGTSYKLMELREEREELKEVECVAAHMCFEYAFILLLKLHELGLNAHCEKSFTQSDILKTHERINTG
ncbi:uncharacterized protein LOC127625506 [Xyrauchen texanus]|uniref:uncharacterized protein LOC127625506 n=1 Tax=Xyrauchen texanus TaxID=154827 RepID=UPI002242823F|nr:uncharacterized protein LOC127625506 [Xyrauchen texanus]